MNGDGELKDWVKSLDKRMAAIEQKIDKIIWRIATMMGGIVVLAFFANRILG